MMTPEYLMEMAIAEARLGIAEGQSPFGCAIASRGQIVVACHNTVLETTDSTAHAEINAIRHACERRGSIFLDGCIAATTCEPCPMCMAALHWARIDHVYYGASIADAAKAGFNELQLPASRLLALGGSPVPLTADVLADECRALFTEWQRSPNPTSY